MEEQSSNTREKREGKKKNEKGIEGEDENRNIKM